jgi:hypothetical protein
MKTALLGAAVAALSLGLGATPAFARATDTQPGGHYEWRTIPQPGPRSAMPVARKRVWVPDPTQMANCECGMMRMSPGECMKPMPGKANGPSAG